MPAQQKAGSSRCAGETPGCLVVAALCPFRILRRTEGPVPRRPGETADGRLPQTNRIQSSGDAP